MKSRRFTLTAAAVLLLLLLTVNTALAEPNATLQAYISSAEKYAGGGILVNVDIIAKESSEPYSAMDFSVISSNYEQLYVLDKAKNEEEKLYQISFAEDYGNAYHKGRVDEETGEIDYMIGIFSQNASNDMQEEIEVCTVSFVYTGEEPENITVTDLQLVYFDEDGTVRNTRYTDSVELEITRGLVKGGSTQLYIGIGIAVVAAGLFVIFLSRKKRA